MGEEPGTGRAAMTGTPDPQAGAVHETAQDPQAAAVPEAGHDPQAAPGTSDPSAAATSRDPEEIEREIEQTRAQLGDTVEALAHKTDVKAQASQKVEHTKAAVSEKLGRLKQASPDGAGSAASQVSQKVRENPLPVVAAGAFAAGLLAARLARR